MAGGGVKGGFAYGATDDYGYEAVDNKVHIHDWHATILHLLGLDHEKLTYRYAGRDMRLTDVKGTWSRTSWLETTKVDAPRRLPCMANRCLQPNRVRSSEPFFGRGDWSLVWIADDTALGWNWTI